MKKKREKTSIHKATALAIWERRFEGSYMNQKRDRPSTWVLDPLWRAACWDASAEDADHRGDYPAVRERRGRMNEILAAHSAAAFTP